MYDYKKRYGNWGLVAGAAEGLGASFSTVLARWGINLILVDKSRDALLNTTNELKSLYGIEVRQVLLDLSKIESVDILLNHIMKEKCRLIVYNAAYGPVKDFMDNTPEELDYYIDLNSRIPLHLIYGFLKTVPKKERAGILLMSSLAGLWGTQLVTPYGATKAFDYNLAEGLHYELKDKNIDVMACCAGATDTPNYQSTHPKKNLLGPGVMNPHKVAENALKKIGKKALYIPGFANQLTYFLLTRIFPRSFSTWMMNRVMYKMYRA